MMLALKRELSGSSQEYGESGSRLHRGAARGGETTKGQRWRSFQQSWENEDSVEKNVARLDVKALSPLCQSCDTDGRISWG